MHWFENYYAANSRAWLVVGPPTARCRRRPPRRSSGRGRAAARAGRGPADSWEDRSLYDRCITRGVPGSMMPAIYGNSYQIQQGPGFVTITYEMVHDTRVIPLDGRPHLAGSIRQYMGDARGRWEGNTLVVETTNFTDKTPYRGSSDQLKMIERFTPLGPDTVEWAVTLDDSRTWARPWTFAMNLTHDDIAAAVRVRLPRGQLRPAQHPRGRPRRRADGGGRAVRTVRMPSACGAAVVATVALATTLDAHHSIPAVYDSRRQVTVTGNVREFQFVNPHPWIGLDVAGDAGRVQTWRLELDNRFELVDVGMRSDTLKPGDIGRRHRQRRPRRRPQPVRAAARSSRRRPALRAGGGEPPAAVGAALTIAGARCAAEAAPYDRGGRRPAATSTRT